MDIPAEIKMVSQRRFSVQAEEIIVIGLRHGCLAVTGDGKESILRVFPNRFRGLLPGAEETPQPEHRERELIARRVRITEISGKRRESPRHKSEPAVTHNQRFQTDQHPRRQFGFTASDRSIEHRSGMQRAILHAAPSAAGIRVFGGNLLRLRQMIETVLKGVTDRVVVK